ncbi:hypothetical protein T4E_2418 [Trichinella pseudospiralis]|uniref:Uncharacterized protein n=1 Tax=Trichinella pseudospiralis TaxID=6337 RepID=A0A0V0Y6C7_TRIPS|nr:hypothetical protein T4E_2418 [Trichinella pseudospiralis]
MRATVGCWSVDQGDLWCPDRFGSGGRLSNRPLATVCCWSTGKQTDSGPDNDCWRMGRKKQQKKPHTDKLH